MSDERNEKRTAARKVRRQVNDDEMERRVRFYLGVVIVVVTFAYVIVASATKGSDHPLSLPDWRYLIPFVLASFVVVFQLEWRDVRAILGLFAGPLARMSEMDDEDTDA